jgi:membrane-associated HD superfamily phosphohydrolase
MMPADSARLIRRHVPDGVALVAEYRLGEPVPDFVREHHGTRWIEYFAHKAREAGLDCEPGDFQYPGPRPRSKETAILMIADQVEAISRTMPHATADDYRNLVRDVVDRLRTEGQLDQAPLTLRDLDRIRESIAGAVAGMHHRRIEYPPPVSPGALRDSPPK